MRLPLYWVDAFTSRVFTGNPSAVVPLTHWLDDEMLQRIAFENGLSETAFVLPTASGDCELRWFTPAVEVDLCGHATLATAHVLFTQLGHNDPELIFHTRSGVLSVARRAQGLLELDFPARPAEPCAEPPTFAAALGKAPLEVLRTKTAWLAVFGSAQDVRDLRPDHRLLGSMTPGRFIVTARGDDCDFVSRFFAPEVGVREDPVTGSAHCTLVPYWAEQLKQLQFHARQVSARGGELWCHLDGPRVMIAGHAVLYLRGEIDV
jgi:PhzF family phenazine biosynthesis protein